ncbi:PhzF family phenazine biosynthesis protein [Polaribacter sp. Hel1_85]|uniref:PhzF family phenazine biosynthesis protein n=1 Tax=Polaribacter sp. Hel1_85 TaxID=1250005 RepID=UPI00052DC1CD|nr:PhzF family phenazine biosynthesis protein [Polaribacter sp. Hel1_85]KGL61711.1 phenazine biosynthesis protein PhzF [Polaribacter sp. Hel1_85]
MNIKTFIVDAFTNERFKGNPAGVCILKNSIDDNLMLSIAKELGLSETAFVTKTRKNHFSIRYYSPKMEIPLCGHATLASSKVLFSKDINLDKIYFETIQNLKLEIRKCGNEIIMQFPIYETEPSTVSNELTTALGLNAYKNCEYNKETNILMLEIDDSEVLNRLKPDFEALYKSNNTINGVLVTALSKHKNYDFESRYFWPWSGTNEDPVTGGTHTFLAKYWSKRIGKTKMKSLQCSERSGNMEVELLDEKNLTIKSNAQIVFKGKIKV